MVFAHIYLMVDPLLFIMFFFYNLGLVTPLDNENGTIEYSLLPPVIY